MVPRTSVGFTKNEHVNLTVALSYLFIDRYFDHMLPLVDVWVAAKHAFRASTPHRHVFPPQQVRGGGVSVAPSAAGSDAGNTLARARGGESSDTGSVENTSLLVNAGSFMI